MSSRVLEHAHVTSAEAGLIEALHRFSGADGDRIAGVLAGVLHRLAVAREKHPRYAENVWHGWGFVGEEYGEANKELTKARPGWLERAEEEMADLVVVTLRMMLREYQHGEDA